MGFNSGFKGLKTSIWDLQTGKVKKLTYHQLDVDPHLA